MTDETIAFMRKDDIFTEIVIRMYKPFGFKYRETKIRWDHKDFIFKYKGRTKKRSFEYLEKYFGLKFKKSYAQL